jgi:asparagine synthase (glutamine-hydrolysing)
MVSPDGRWILTFNGEIYNYIELRRELERQGCTFKSRSDTEVLLHTLITWGRDGLARLNGIFGFALWDEHSGRLLVGRDRLGVKPVYYATQGESFCFASEIKAILGSGLIEPKIDPAALESYLRLLWVPEPGTLFAGIRKLDPGATLLWDGKRALVERYWDVPAPEGPVAMDEAAQRVGAALESAVKRQLRSDVPVGAFLSGGIDSTAIVGLAAKLNLKEVRTYTIRFRSEDRVGEGAVDDSKYSRLVAEWAGVRHEEIVISPDVVSLLPKIVRHLEDPVADPAALNTLLICEAARSSSTVLLSGSGGDELFGGYRKYPATMFAARYQRIPKFVRERFVNPLARRLPVQIGGVGLREVRFAKKFLRYADHDAFDRFLGYSTYYDAVELQELLGGDPSQDVDQYRGLHPLKTAWDSQGSADLITRMLYLDLKYYLPGLGLAYMDKASMAASVEVRVPLLDDEVVDVVSRLPADLKVKGMSTKVVLREALRGKIPEFVLKRPKAPFAAPVRSWLKGPLAPMVAEFMRPSSISARGLLNPAVVQALILEHNRGAEDNSLRLWALLTLEVWLQEFIDTSAAYRMPADWSSASAIDLSPPRCATDTLGVSRETARP